LVHCKDGGMSMTIPNFYLHFFFRYMFSPLFTGVSERIFIFIMYYPVQKCSTHLLVFWHIRYFYICK